MFRNLEGPSTALIRSRACHSSQSLCFSDAPSSFSRNDFSENMMEVIEYSNGGFLNSSTSRKKTLSSKKVSIIDLPETIKKDTHRTSLIEEQIGRKARKIRVFINGDKFFKGAIIAVSDEKFRTFDKLLEHLTRVLGHQVTLPNGVRFIFNLEGKVLESVSDLGHFGNYVCSSFSLMKKIDYCSLCDRETMKRENGFGVMSFSSPSTSNKSKRENYKLSGHSKSFGISNGKNDDFPSPFLSKPKIIAVLRGGYNNRPRKALRVLLNCRNAKSYDNLLCDLTNVVKLDSGAVRKVFSLSGKPVVCLLDFNEEDVFIVYGMAEKVSSEDFDLDFHEFRTLQSFLKSPALESKYNEKFSINISSPSSPKSSSRHKFQNSRLPVKNRKASRSRLSYTPENIFNSEIESKYEVGDVIGDGNFAVVKRIVSRKSGIVYALKIIDKSKCVGKEHMIDSEITILNLLNHPHIIELIEVFDSPEEKCLVTEYVSGGDLFDVITRDTKYSELQSKIMVSDLTSALKFLHDKMIVHRDIKPENLFVFDKEKGFKSLKLGDFGLAQVVNEPLFTVCGTPSYVAPEILAETGYGVKVDVWATGVIMYILLSGFPPFSSRSNNQEELFDQILSGIFEFNSPDWDDISYPAKELIAWMLQVDPLQRYSAYEILQHPWITSSS